MPLFELGQVQADFMMLGDSSGFVQGGACVSTFDQGSSSFKSLLGFLFTDLIGGCNFFGHETCSLAIGLDDTAIDGEMFEAGVRIPSLSPNA